MNRELRNAQSSIVEPEYEAVRGQDQEKLMRSRRLVGMSCRSVETRQRSPRPIPKTTIRDRNEGACEDDARESVGCPPRTMKVTRLRRSRAVPNYTR